MKPLEKTNNNIWIISGPAAVGKNWSVLEPLEKLNIPNLVVQDMDRLKDLARSRHIQGHAKSLVEKKISPSASRVLASIERQ